MDGACSDIPFESGRKVFVVAVAFIGQEGFISLVHSPSIAISVLEV